METKNIYEKLLSVQVALKAPKSQYNAFGHYNYRNCEDILEAAKPLCKEVKAVVLLTDDIVLIGERYYVKATARFIDVESGSSLDAVAFAREEESKKGMDGSQVTGTSSSYARKYALNGLFDIDDTKDSDTTNTQGKEDKPPKKEDKPPKKEDKPKQQPKPQPKPQTEETPPRDLLIDKLKEKGIDPKVYAAEKGLTKETDAETYLKLLAELEA